MFCRRPFFVLSVFVLAACFVAAAPEAAEIEKLVQQLGSGKFAEREAATKGLELIGTPALHELRKHLNSDDLEVRRRVKDLVTILEKKAESDDALKPTRVKLNFQNKPIQEAVAELAKLSDYSISIEGDLTKLGNRKVTLETGEVTFWEALDKLCAKADLTPRSSPRMGIAMPPASRRPNRLENDNKIVLIDGKLPAGPTCYVGAVRVRVVPNDKSIPLAKGETAITLEITPEPKLQWRNLMHLRVEKAMDDKNQTVTQVAQQSASQEDVEEVIIGNGQRIIRMQAGAPFRAEDLLGEAAGFRGSMTVPVKLKLPADAGKSLKTLKLNLDVQVRTPLDALVTVDNVLDAAGKSHKGKGEEIKLQQATRQDNGDVKIRFEKALQDDVAAGGGNLVVRGNGMVVANASPLNAGAQDVKLYDTDGQAYTIIASNSSFTVTNGVGSSTQQYTFRPKNAGATPKKLVLSGSRIATIEVPVEFKDVPLP